jgi:hypothetical protein
MKNYYILTFAFTLGATLLLDINFFSIATAESKKSREDFFSNDYVNKLGEKRAHTPEKIYNPLNEPAKNTVATDKTKKAIEAKKKVDKLSWKLPNEACTGEP